MTSLGCSCGSPWTTLVHVVGKPLENNRTPDSSQASPPITRPRATKCRAQQVPQTDRPPMLGPNPYGDLEIYTRMPNLRIFDWKMLMFGHSKSARRLNTSSSKGEAKNGQIFEQDCTGIFGFHTSGAIPPKKVRFLLVFCFTLFSGWCSLRQGLIFRVVFGARVFAPLGPAPAGWRSAPGPKGP